MGNFTYLFNNDVLVRLIKNQFDKHMKWVTANVYQKDATRKLLQMLLQKQYIDIINKNGIEEMPSYGIIACITSAHYHNLTELLEYMSDQAEKGLWQIH